MTSESSPQSQAMFQQALLEVTATSKQNTNIAKAGNLLGGGTMMMTNQQATSTAQVRNMPPSAAGGTAQRIQPGNPQLGGRVMIRQITAQQQVPTSVGLTAQQFVAPNVVAPGASVQRPGNTIPQNVTAGHKINTSIPVNAADLTLADDGKLFMMKQCGQGYVLTPYGNEKQAQIADACSTGAATRIDINLLQNVKDSVADPTLLAYLNGKEVPKNVKFKCKLCNAKTDSLNMIRWHLYAHHLQSAPRPFKCLKCAQSFFSEKHAQDHERDVHNMQKCHTFDETITQIAQKHSATMFKVYAAIVKEPEEVKQQTGILTECQICLQRAVDLNSMRIHMEAMHNPFRSAAFQCWYCPECSDVEETLKEHVRKVHVNQPPQYTRDTPPGKKREKITNRLMEFTKQVPTAPNQIRSFSITEIQPENVEESELISCPLCTFISVQTVSLENHLKNDHLPFKPYLCHGNDYKAATIKMLKKHLAQKHNEWLQSGSLHKRVSIDGELSACQDRETSRLILRSLQKGLENSIDFSSDKHIPFDNKCSECQYKASTHTMLEMHIKLRHLLSTPHICQICGVATALRESMQNHIQKKHPTEIPVEDIIYTDEGGENLQEEETMKIVIRSICNNSNDQDEEIAAEPDSCATESDETAAGSDKTAAEFDKTAAESDKTAAELGKAVAELGKAVPESEKTTTESTKSSDKSAAESVKSVDEVNTNSIQNPGVAQTPISNTETVAQPVQPATTTVVQSVLNSVLQPVVTPAVQPIANLAVPIITPVTVTAQPISILPQPMLLVPVMPVASLPQTSPLPVLSASQGAPILSATSTESSTVSETDPMISAVRIKIEPGLEETDSSCTIVHNKISEFLYSRPSQSVPDENSSGNNVVGSEDLAPILIVSPGADSVTMVSPTVSGANPANNLGIIPVATSREIPNTASTVLRQSALQSVSPLLAVQSVPSTTSNENCVQSATPSRVIQASPRPVTPAGSLAEPQKKKSTTPEEQALDRVDSASRGTPPTEKSKDLNRSLESGQLGEKQNNSLVSVTTDEDTNAVVISISETGQDKNSNGVKDLGHLPIKPSATCPNPNTSSVKTVADAQKTKSVTSVSQSKAVANASKSTRVSPVGDMSNVTSLFTGQQMRETLGKASAAVPQLTSPTTPESPDFEKAYKCHKCEEVFPKWVEVRQHCIINHLSEYWQFYCEQCDFRTWNHPLMREHMKAGHNSSDFVKSDKRRQELLQTELKEMQNLVKTVLVPKKTSSGSDDAKKTVAWRRLSSKDMSFGDIKKRLLFRKQKSKSKDGSKEHGQGSKSPVVINPAILNAPFERMQSFEKVASEDPDSIRTCFKCRRYRQGSLVEVNVPLIHITVVNEKECLFRCDCDYSTTKVPPIVFHIWAHTGLSLYHCSLCMAEGNEKKEMAAHCQTNHHHEVGLHNIRLFKSIVKLLEKRMETVSSTLEQHHRKRPVITSPEDGKQTEDIKKALYKCAYCTFQRCSVLEVVSHEQLNHSFKMTKITMDFRASMDNGVTERLYRGTLQNSPVVAPASNAAGEKAEPSATSTGVSSNQGDKPSQEKHAMMKINIQKGKRKAGVLDDSEGSHTSSEELEKARGTKKRRDSHPRESRSKECHLCDYVTESNKDLEHHLLSRHTTIRPYECSRCKKGYLLKEDARNHIHRRHANTSAKLVIKKQMEIIMNEARLQMLKYAKQKQLSGQSQHESEQSRPYKRIKLLQSNNLINNLAEYARQLNDPKLAMKPVVKLKDVTKSKRYKRYIKKKR
jgi:hypothetical protein